MKLSFAPGRAWCIAGETAVAVLDPDAPVADIDRAHDIVAHGGGASELAAAIGQSALAVVSTTHGVNTLLRYRGVPAVVDGEPLNSSGTGNGGAPAPELIPGSLLELGNTGSLAAAALPFLGGVTRVASLRVTFEVDATPGVVARAAEVGAPETDELSVFTSIPGDGHPALVLQSGERIPLDRGVLVGRRPESDRVDGGRPPRLVTVGGLSMVISRTHLRVESTQGGVMATDLGSTNGTTVSRPGTLTQRLRADVPTRLHAGDILGLGDGVAIALSD
ncbi:FHA domain-containing protein [uncultured Agrococcus sp.]|uniref:FHA domain-containing protein n=1 Tax=uncultured Agrococcus sp. TaxID=382258 RepID=UPI0025D6187C|nr:FHA domain-containing protein [uncultured Agrococcus sp.]